MMMNPMISQATTQVDNLLLDVVVIRIHDFFIVYLCRRKRNIPESHLKKIETKTNLFIDLRYGIIRMFLTLISTNITKAQVLLQLLRPEEDYQLVLRLVGFL
jgi:hypothetical protein